MKAPPPDAAIPPQWQCHYDALVALRDQVARHHEERERALHQPAERGGTDMVDTANDQRDRLELLAELHFDEAELAEIEAALERIRLGTYGRCEATGRPISAVRLASIPWTRFSARAAVARARKSAAR